MKNLVVVSVILASVAMILGIITHLHDNSILISAGAWNDLTQTLLLFAIAFGIWGTLSGKKE